MRAAGSGEGAAARKPEKPRAPAAERNAAPIAEVLREAFAERRSVLEIGSGTGQHAVHFARAMPWLHWQASDVAAHLPGIRLWLAEAALANTPPPLPLDVNGVWPEARYDAIFTANTLHIMSWQEVERLFAGLPGVAQPAATLVVYGPFRRHGAHTAPSNAAFERQLQAEVPHRGIRDMEAVDALAAAAGFSGLRAVPMPANNFCLIWQRRG